MRTPHVLVVGGGDGAVMAGWGQISCYHNLFRSHQIIPALRTTSQPIMGQHSQPHPSSLCKHSSLITCVCCVTMSM